MAGTYFDENPTVTLRDAIDLNELRRPNNEGVLFEVKEDSDDIEPEATNNTCFDPEELSKNLYREDESDTSDEDDDRTQFERLEAKMMDISPDRDGGVMKLILSHGAGPVVPAESLVWTHYNAYWEYADEPFDSTRLNDRQQKFRLGRGDVTPGFDIAVATMKKGEVSRFLIKSDYFYGPIGEPPRIPGGATALFEIELLNFVERAGLDDYFLMSEEEKRQVPFSDIQKLYKTITNEAKHYFQGGRIRQAYTKYKKASSLIEQRFMKNAEEEKEQQALLLKVYLNSALCCIKLGHSGRAVSLCRQSLEIDNQNAKALYLNAKALHQLGEYARATGMLKRAKKLKPANREINEELEKIEKDIAKFRILEKSMYSKMLSQPLTASEEEEKKADERAQKAESRCMECSDKFRDLVLEKMQEFKDDAGLMEMPLPSYNLTIGEIDCIVQTAEGLDLRTMVKGEGSQKQIRVLKKQPEVST